MKRIIIILLLLSVAACKQETNLQPKEVVTLYFNSWETKDYRTMYSLISDGFKKIEPTAATYEQFSAEAEKYYETANELKLLKVSDATIDGDSATVSYTIEIDLKTGKRTYDGAYTLRKRANGWKLIHPYGQNIDVS